MQDLIVQARKIIAALLAIHYTNFDLLADHLENDGQYRSFWEADNIVIIAVCNDIFNENSMIMIYELSYKECRFPRVTIAC